MNAHPIANGDAVFAPLDQFGLLSVTGEDARAFLHGQLSNDVEHLLSGQARRAGYCSAKGRLLATLLLVPRDDGFLAQVSKDIAAPIAKRLTMYVMRSKVRIAEVSGTWAQFGVWGNGAANRLQSAGFEAPGEAMQAAESKSGIVVAMGDDRFLVFGPPEKAATLSANFTQVVPDGWTLGDVRAGLPLVTLPTQDLFVPQMANFDLVGGIDFKKGCYPGQEIVARTQYLGKLKRRMYRGEIDAPGGSAPAAGQDLFGTERQAIGTVVNVAPRGQGGYELLAVIQSSAVEQGDPIRVGTPEGSLARITPLPYAV